MYFLDLNVLYLPGLPLLIEKGRDENQKYEAGNLPRFSEKQMKEKYTFLRHIDVLYFLIFVINFVISIKLCIKISNWNLFSSESSNKTINRELLNWFRYLIYLKYEELYILQLQQNDWKAINFDFKKIKMIQYFKSTLSLLILLINKWKTMMMVLNRKKADG